MIGSTAPPRHEIIVIGTQGLFIPYSAPLEFDSGMLYQRSSSQTLVLLCFGGIERYFRRDH